MAITRIGDSPVNSSTIQSNSYSPATKVVAPKGSGFVADYYTTGTADDVTIQTVLTAAGTAGGGIVLCKTGDYQITAKLKIPTDVYLVGEGMKTRFIATSALADHMIINKDVTNSNIQIRDIYLDCTGTTTGNGTVIQLNGVTDGKIFNVETNGGIGAGIVIAGCTRTNIIRTTAHNSTWSGIWLQQNNVDCTVDQCIVYANGTPTQNSGHGIEIGNLTNNNNSFCRISNNICHNNQNGIRWYGFGQHHLDIIGNICYNNGESSPTVDGNGISESSGSTAGTIACHDINIIGNNCYSNSDSGISVATSSSGVPAAYGYNISGNICTDNRNVGIQATNLVQSIIANNSCSYNSKQGIYAQSCSQAVSITGNSVFYNQTNGIEVKKFSFGIISNNNLYGNGQLADNTYVDIFLNDDGSTFSSFNTVSGNNATNFLTNRTQAAIQENASGDDYNLITNNAYTGQRGTELVIRGTHTRQANNYHTNTTEIFQNTGFTALSTITLSTGTATAGTAPLKFVAGTNLTSAEAGAMEYDGTDFYLTRTTTRRAILAADFNNVSGTLAIANGGTGQTTYTDGQLLIGNTTGNTLAKATLTGTANQITVTNGHGTITLSTPQNIHTGASPTFAGLTISGSISTSGVTSSDQVIVSGTAGSLLVAGRNGATNPVFNVDASTTSAATGLNIKGAAAAGGLAVSVLSSGTDENLTIDAKGAGTITFGSTSTGNIVLNRILNLGANSLNTVGNIEIDGTAARDITVAQSATTTGRNLTIQAGQSVTGGTNETGGALILKSGLGTGSNGSGVIIFQTSSGLGSGTTTQSFSEKGRFANSTNGRFVIGDASGGVSGAADGLNLMGTVARAVVVVRNTTAATGGQNLTVQAGGATSSTTDKSGGQLILLSGISTGTGTSQLKLQTMTKALSTGTSDNTATDRIVITSPLSVTNNSATTISSLTLAAGSISGQNIHYCVEVTDGTDYQCETGIVSFAIVNKGGAFTAGTPAKTGNVQALSSGTLTVTFTQTSANPSLIQVNANSSLTPSTGYPRITFYEANLTQQAVAVS